jgi:hypothetical protein
MPDDKTHLSNFVKNIFEDDFAKAKEELQAAIVEKLKGRMKTQMEEQYQPKTGATCSCKQGKQRDNCTKCEGTGKVVDFKAIREKGKTMKKENN